MMKCRPFGRVNSVMRFSKSGSDWAIASRGRMDRTRSFNFIVGVSSTSIVAFSPERIPRNRGWKVLPVLAPPATPQDPFVRGGIRKEFVFAHPPVVVLIEREEGCRGVQNFARRDLAVVIRIEGSQHRMKMHKLLTDGARWMRHTEATLLSAELVVMILGEREKRHRRVRDLGRGNDAVVIRVE